LFRIVASSRPTVETKYPWAQKCCPTKLRFLSPYTSARRIAYYSPRARASNGFLVGLCIKAHKPKTIFAACAISHGNHKTMRVKRLPYEPPASQRNDHAQARAVRYCADWRGAFLARCPGRPDPFDVLSINWSNAPYNGYGLVAGGNLTFSNGTVWKLPSRISPVNYACFFSRKNLGTT